MQIQPSGMLAARAAIVTAMVIWGTAIVFSKVVVVETGPILLATLRLAIASAVFVPFSLRGLKLRSLPVAPLALSGFLGMSLYYVLLNVGLMSSSAASAGLIQGAAPIFTVILSLLFLREQISAARLGGVFCSVVGVFIIVLSSATRQAGLSNLTGNLLVVGSTISWAAYVITSKKLAQQYPQQLVTAGQLFFGFLFLLPLAIVEIAMFGFGEITLKNFTIIVYLGLVSSGAAYLLWNFSLKSLSATEAGAFTNLAPLVTFVAAVIFLNESVSAVIIIGGCLVIAGLYLAGLPGRAGIRTRAQPSQTSRR